MGDAVLDIIKYSPVCVTADGNMCVSPRTSFRFKNDETWQMTRTLKLIPLGMAVRYTRIDQPFRCHYHEILNVNSNSKDPLIPTSTANRIFLFD